LQARRCLPFGGLFCFKLPWARMLPDL